jgi:hypothetical protein
MSVTKKLACLSSMSAACLIVLNFGLAADDCSGHYVNVGQSAETTELANGTVVAVFKATTINITDDRSSPMNLSVGDCGGKALTANGKTDASGRCSR